MPRHTFMPFSLIAILWCARIVHMGPRISLLLIGAAWLTVLVHELGHVAVIKRAGGRVRGLIATPFMGITFHDPDCRKHLVALALSGPAAGAAFGAGILFEMHALGLPHTQTFIALRLVLLAGLLDNLVFNLLPIGTLDGAYLLQALRERRARRAFRARVGRELGHAWNAAHAARRTLAPAVRPQPNPRPIRVNSAYTTGRWSRENANGRVPVSSSGDMI
jgi:Zn-dependent protease